MRIRNAFLSAVIYAALPIAVGCNESSSDAVRQPVAAIATPPADVAGTVSTKTPSESAPPSATVTNAAQVASQSAGTNSGDVETLTIAITEPLADVPEEVASQVQPPATVAQVAAALDLAKFPQPKNVSTSFIANSQLYFETDQPLEITRAEVMDELLKRGFTSDDEIDTSMATVTINLQNRPMTIMLSNSFDDNVTHVQMWRHQGIDDSTVPLLEAIGPIDKRVDRTYYTTPIGVIQGQQLLRAKCEEKSIPIARMMSSKGSASILKKDSLRFVCQIEESTSTEFESPAAGRKTSSRVNLTGLGNLICDDLPVPDDFEKPAQPYNAVFGNLSFRTNAKATDAINRSTKLLEESGWRKVDSARPTIADREKLLIRGGAMLNLRATEFGPGRTHVEYSLNMRAFDLPDRLGARLVRVDSAAPGLFFTTATDLDTVVDYYTEHLAKVGWDPDGKMRSITPERYVAKYDGNYFQPLLVDIQRKGGDTTWVDLRISQAEEIAALIKNASPTPARVAKASAASPPPAAEPDNSRDLPDTSREFDSDVAALEAAMDAAEIPDTPEKIAEMARKQMEESLQGLPAEQAAQVRAMMESSFKGAFGSEEPKMESDLSEPDTVASTVQPPGLDVKEETPAQEAGATPELPEGKLAAKDFPIPKSAKDVSRDLNMISFRVDSVIENAKFVAEKLQEMGWKPRGETMMESDMAIMKFQKGKGTLDVSLIQDERQSPPVRAVIHGDGLFFPDPYGGEPDLRFDDEKGDGGDSKGGAGAPDSFSGLPIPQGLDSVSTTESRFRSELTGSWVSDIKTTANLIRKGAKESGWKIASEQSDGNQKAGMVLTKDETELTVDLIAYDSEVEIRLASRNPKEAKPMGFVPKQGTGRIILANASESEVTVTINGLPYKLAAMQGARDPTKGIRLDVKPGGYNYTIQAKGRADQTDRLKIIVGGTWGIIVIPEQGHMAERMY